MSGCGGGGGVGGRAREGEMGAKGGANGGSKLRALSLSVSSGEMSGVMAARSIVSGGGKNAQEWASNGGPDALSRALLLRRPRLLSPLLSTLADCCLDEEFRIQVGKLNICEELVNNLKHATDDHIIGKTCRVIGNLAQEIGIAEQLHSNGAVGAIQTILENDKIETSTPTVTLAVRAIRLLWMVTDRQKEIIEMGAVKTVAVILCNECAKLDAKKNSPKKIACKRKSDLFSGLLKCIGYFSKHSTAQCAEQILGDGRGYACLVSLTKDYKSLALQCIINLCYVEECLPLLGAAGAVERLIDLLNSQSDWPSPWIKALSILCRISANQWKLTEHDGLPLLIAIVKDVSKLSCHLYALQALLHFLMNQEAFEKLAKEGAIDVFGKLLKQYVSDSDYDHQPENNFSKKEKTEVFKFDNVNDDDSSDCNSVYNKNAPEKSWPFNDYWDFACSPNKKMKCHRESKFKSSNLSPHSDYSSANSPSPEYNVRNNVNSCAGTSSNYSPESPSSSIDGHTSNYWSTSQWSPASIGLCYSPSSISQCDEDSVDSEWSAHYSPVCSDGEDTVMMTSIDIECQSECNEMTEAFNDLVEDDNLTQELLQQNTNIQRMYSYRIQSLLTLIYMFSFCSSKISVKLTSSELLYTLISYIEKCKHPMRNLATKTFIRIISNYTNLRHILKHNIVLHLFTTTRKPKHEKCRQCKQVFKTFGKLNNQISNVAESEYGIGVICHQLLKGDHLLKENLVLTLPFVTRTNRALKKFFVTCEALELFLTILSTHKKPLEHCVPALAKLATNLCIPAPKPVIAEFEGFTISNYEPVFDKDDEIVFILDDASMVRGNVKLLCEYSDVFVAMLKGVFKEANQKCVRLQKASKEGLEYLFILLEAGVHLKTVSVFPLPKTVDVALEALLLADRFLMDQVKNMLFSAIIQFKLDSTTADRIYIWSLEEGMGTLCMESVAYTLVGKMSDDKRCCIVVSIMNSIYKDQWIDDVRYSLLRFMV